MIVQELHKIQHTHRYLPDVELRKLAERTGTPLYRLQEVASFFPHFKLSPPPAVEVHICHDMACHQRGCTQMKQDLQSLLASECSAGTVAVEYASCLGRCDRPVAAMVNDTLFVSRSAESLAEIAQSTLAGRPHQPDADGTYALNANRPWRIDPYNGPSTYQAVRLLVASGDRAAVIEQLKASDLRGMGGAGVPAHQKWSDVWHAKGDEKYIVCNADESEPGTFKDRELLTQHAHLVLEGVILAGIVTGATRGTIYIRHEYAEQIEVMQREIIRAQDLGACGQGIFKSTLNFPVEVFASPGGYICGEQSALIEAMEDRRGQPRNKPPQLETNGLYDKPTLVSNVETFAWAPAIMINGGQWYAQEGINGCKGRRFFSISGDVAKPGVYEVPCGVLLGTLIELAGGVVGELKAFAPSGPSGGFLPRMLPVSALPRGWEKRVPAELLEKVTTSGGLAIDILDLQLDLQRFRDLGLAIGAGLVVYNDTRDMVVEALNCSQFFRDESCGKCVPCRIGSEKIVEIGESIVGKRLDTTEFKKQKELVKELTRAMEMTSICGLGMVAAKPLESALALFPADLAGHLRGGKT
ncbi:MAG: NADH-quinone oxidoreductase subunit L [Planctomycetota bacterium]|nr:MAG: NADH-quinone oxidoreductase subunit L [Planctomycetota bacterium]